MESGKRWFTDKMPLNETHLGLIALLFPASPIIHVVRHPMDVVLSVFSNQLTHGFYCAYELESAAKHYALVADLIAHYRSEMPLRYLPVRYEDMVADQETHIRRMLDFIGEPFDEACLQLPREQALRPHRQLRPGDREALRPLGPAATAATPSHIAPIAPILQPAMDRLGYAFDEKAAA